MFASAAPVARARCRSCCPRTSDADAVLAALRARYAGRGVELAEVAGGVQFRTAPDLAPALRKVVRGAAPAAAGRRWRRWRSSPTTSR